MSRTIGQLKKDPRSKSKKQSQFLDKLSDYVSVTRACKVTKIPRSTIYQWIKDDPEFKARFEDACELALASLEDEAVRRAFEGVNKPVYQQGQKVGTVKDFSDTLMIVLLKARAPDKYKDRFAGELSGINGKDLPAPQVNVYNNAPPLARSEDEIG